MRRVSATRAGRVDGAGYRTASTVAATLIWSPPLVSPGSAPPAGAGAPDVTGAGRRRPPRHVGQHEAVTNDVAFLRAVDLGRRTVPMARLVESAKASAAGVWTHANSGNAVFSATGSRATIERAMERALEAAMGFEVTTFVRTVAELRHAVGHGAVPAGRRRHLLHHVPQAGAAGGGEAGAGGGVERLRHDRGARPRRALADAGKSTDTRIKGSTWKTLGEHASTSRNVNLLTKLVAKIDRTA